jgi:hypothetical protein
VLGKVACVLSPATSLALFIRDFIRDFIARMCLGSTLTRWDGTGHVVITGGSSEEVSSAAECMQFCGLGALMRVLPAVIGSTVARWGTLLVFFFLRLVLPFLAAFCSSRAKKQRAMCSLNGRAQGTSSSQEAAARR